jgi:putative ABC transport system substrate-binding protein
LAAKRLELLRELCPKTVRLAVLVNPSNATSSESQVSDLSRAAIAMSLQIQIVKASSSGEINAAFAGFERDRPDAVFVTSDGFFTTRRVQFANLASRYAVPASFSAREIADAGGLTSYGADLADAFRQVGIYVGRILSGAKPAELPVIQSVKFALVINLQTARMLSLEVPPQLLARADEVIE